MWDSRPESLRTWPQIVTCEGYVKIKKLAQEHTVDWPFLDLHQTWLYCPGQNSGQALDLGVLRLDPG